MTIRDATVDDVGAIQTVAQESWTQDYPDILSRESLAEGLDEWYSDERIRDSIVWARALMLVAERGDEIVGFAHAAWGTDANEGNILRVYVAPDHRGDGIGRQLLEETCRSLFEEDVDRIKAMVLDANELGTSFYSDFGFEQTETTEISIGGETHRERTYVLERESDETKIGDAGSA